MRRVGKKALIEVYSKFFSAIEYSKTIEGILSECNDELYKQIAKKIDLETDIKVIRKAIKSLYTAVNSLDKKMQPYDIDIIDSFQPTLVVKDIFYLDREEDIDEQLSTLKNYIRDKLRKGVFNIPIYSQLNNIIDSLLDIPENLSVEGDGAIEVIHNNMINYVVSSVKIRMINTFGTEYKDILESLENKLREMNLPAYVLRQQFTESI